MSRQIPSHMIRSSSLEIPPTPPKQCANKDSALIRIVCWTRYYGARIISWRFCVSIFRQNELLSQDISPNILKAKMLIFGSSGRCWTSWIENQHSTLFQLSQLRNLSKIIYPKRPTLNQTALKIKKPQNQHISLLTKRWIETLGF